MSELIRKQDALDALGEEPPVWYDGEDEIAERNQWRRDVKAIKAVPTVQPEIHFDEWCTDCKEYDHEKHCCPRFNKVIRRTVEELKAQPKTGKWINGHWDGDSNFRIDGRGNCWYIRECSNCHEEIEGKPTKYCPECGARMLNGR